MTERINCFKLFVLANFVTFTFIALLQLAKGWLFWLFLVFMHAGIVMFILNKRKMMAYDQSVKHYYDRVYLLLGLYLPLLFYKLVGYVAPGSYNETLATMAMVGVFAVSVLGSIVNTIRFYEYLFKDNVTQKV